VTLVARHPGTVHVQLLTVYVHVQSLAVHVPPIIKHNLRAVLKREGPSHWQPVSGSQMTIFRGSDCQGAVFDQHIVKEKVYNLPDLRS
jgi:hypothetical protein